MNTSAHLARRSKIFAASGDLRSIATPRLLRLFRCHMYGYLDCGCGGILFPILHNSPLGGSTLITSAPKSDRITAAPGPATKLERSTTLSPEKMLSVVVVFSVFIIVSSFVEIQRPWNWAPRFCRNACVPSFLSSVPAQSPN